VPSNISGAVVGSSAIKLLLPTRLEGWEWSGVDEWKGSYFARQTANSIKQIIEHKTVKPMKPLGTGAIIGIVIGVIFLLLLIGIPITGLFLGMFM